MHKLPVHCHTLTNYKLTMKNKYILSAVLLAFGLNATVAQQANLPLTTAQQIELAQLKQKELAVEKAKALGLPIRQEQANGKIIELVGLTETGQPLYYQTLNNINAARTLSTDRVWPGGSGGYSLTGSGMTNRLGVWDGGATRVSHQEFQGRAVQTDGATSLSDHATHVAGTMAAGGVGSANYRGGSYQAPIKCYDWNSDLSEMVTAAQAGMLVSNHSYGQICGWYNNGSVWQWYGDVSISDKEDYKYGFYDQNSASWDAQLVTYPNYLPFVAAGNDRGEPGSIPSSFQVRNSSGQWVAGNSSNPPSLVGPYDCIIGGPSNAKNVMTVGAVNSISTGWTRVQDVVMSSFSGWGPTDDGRIKPDIVAAGVNIASASSAGNTNYTTMSGTSMATPNASGSAMLVQQYYQSLKGNFMRASTLKGLIIHTADEAGNAGPDYTFGWGLMNTLKAVNTIKDSLRSAIIETPLANRATYTYNLFTDGTQPLRATICWTDRAGSPVAPALDPTNKMLVNDLDIRIRRVSDNQVFEPFILNPAIPSAVATTGDNNTDNVEQVFIAAPVAGNYQITITHKGNLAQSANQIFSLIVSGITPKPSVSFSTATRVVCANRAVVFNDQSAGATTRMWYFPGSNTPTSTLANPSITYPVPGVYPVALRISNASGFDSVYVRDYITVGGLQLPFLETFENNSTTRSLWTIENPNNDSTFRIWPIGGTTPGNLAMGINNFDGASVSGRFDRIVSPPIDLRGYQNAQLTFQHAYTRETTSSDSLVVYISTNCGTSWIRINGWRENGNGELATAPDTTYRLANSFVPTGAAQWCGGGTGAQCFTLNLTPWVGNHSVRIRFEQRSNLGNNMFIDNINITGSTLAPVANFYSLKRNVCQNEPVLLLDSSRNNATSWEWMFTGANISASTDRNPIVQYAAPGTYSIQLKVANTSGTDSITRTDYITVLAAPVKPTLTADKGINLCDGDSVTLSTNATTFVWFRDSMVQNTITANSWNVKQEGKYFVRETNQAGCFTQSDIVFVTASITPAKPSITKSITGNSFCDGTTFTLTSSAQSNNQWLLNNNVLDSQVNTQLVSGQAGTFGLRVGEKGCYSFADSLVINLLPKPATSNISGQAWAVRNTDQDYNIVRGDANSTIQWSTSGAGILFGQGSNAITVRFGSGSLANISVFETGANGCRGETKTLNISLVNTSINDELLLEKAVVFPNPVSQNMEILFNATANTTGKLIVTDMLGKIISQQDVQILGGENKINYAAHDLANGYYLYSIQAGNAVVNGKFVKQ